MISDELNDHLEAHYKCEEDTLKQLLKLENLFRDVYALTLKEMQTQKDIINRMWVLSQRYIILVTTGPCCKYPDIYSAPAEDVILHEYNDKLKLLRMSCCRLMEAINQLRISCLMFDDLCSHLDMTVESPFILGDHFHKPISFFIELVADLFKYLHAQTLKFKYLSHQLDPADLISLENYKAVLDPSEDFEEYLLKGLMYCKCLRPKLPCGVREPSMYPWE